MRDAKIHTLRISLIPLLSTCEVERGSKGFSLILDGKVLYEDQRLPEIRRCAEDYSITEIRWSGTNVHVALVSAFSIGFEGYDRTFIAIPFVLSPQ
jgi:predicted secreted protein